MLFKKKGGRGKDNCLFTHVMVNLGFLKCQNAGKIKGQSRIVNKLFEGSLSLFCVLGGLTFLKYILQSLSRPIPSAAPSAKHSSLVQLFHAATTSWDIIKIFFRQVAISNSFSCGWSLRKVEPCLYYQP